MRFRTCPVKSANEANCRGGDYLNSAEHNYFAVLFSCAINNRGSTCTIWHSFADFFRVLCFINLLDKGPDLQARIELTEEINV